MKSLSAGKRNLLKFFFTVTVALFFIFPLTGSAQKNKTVKKTETKKTTRIFYGQASFYANKFNGRKTANGEIFSQKKFTCACNVLPLGTWIKVTNLSNGKSVIVKVNDRIHPRMKRIVDLSKVAAQKLDYISKGLTRVKVEIAHSKSAPEK
jgi:rare lipoprotein A